MAFKPLPSQEVLRQLLDYDPETGILRWKERGPEWFQSSDRRSAAERAANFNASHAGKEAGEKFVVGYRRVRLFGLYRWSHRIVWKIVYGVEPEQIDHINGQKDDNRLKNLRAVTDAENALNKRFTKISSSGVLGVTKRSDTGTWQAHIGFRGQKIKLGTFSSLDAAIAARRAAEREYGFHKNHRYIAVDDLHVGEPARDNLDM